VEILVADDGRGFQIRTESGYGSQNAFPESHNGFGLFNIQERVSDLGGRLRIRSEPAKGTAVKMYLPLDTAPRLLETA
jgi:signal transduction histidine kinase